MSIHKMNADRAMREQEIVAELNSTTMYGKRKRVQKAATKILQMHGHKNRIYYVNEGYKEWQINYDEELPFDERRKMERLIAKELQLPTDYTVKLCGVGY